MSAQTGRLTVAHAKTWSVLAAPAVLEPGWRERKGRPSCPTCPHGTAEGMGDVQVVFDLSACEMTL